MENTFTLITGGTSGIGYDAAKQLINEGKQVIITGRNAERVQHAAESLGCKGIVADSTQLSSIQALAAQLVEEKVQLDGLVLNAGIFFPEPFEAASEEVYDQTFATNTKGPFFTLQALLPVMQNPSSVVFISSIVIDKGFEACAAYAASKAAVEAFIRVANIELAAKGIRLNTLRPGVTETPIHGKAGAEPKDNEAFYKSLQSLPLGRVLQPSDHAGVISFLLSEASLPLRNVVIGVDGGHSL